MKSKGIKERELVTVLEQALDYWVGKLVSLPPHDLSPVLYGIERIYELRTKFVVAVTAEAQRK